MTNPIKISQLKQAGSIGDADLLMISKSNGTAYLTNSVTVSALAHKITDRIAETIAVDSLQSTSDKVQMDDADYTSNNMIEIMIGDTPYYIQLFTKGGDSHTENVFSAPYVLA